jgi:MoaA/NifB/PqqE/SkfB family radical SAM enzyme
VHRRASLLYINGQHILPLSHGSAALLRTFMDELNGAAEPGQELSEDQMGPVLERTVRRMHGLYSSEPTERFLGDLGRLQDMIERVASGKEVPELTGHALTMADYAPSMRAPMRMDLAVMPMRIDNVWSCPLACSICYASTGLAMQVAQSEMLTTEQWRQVLETLWRVGVPQISFTGGDPLARSDIADLVASAEKFISRLNTSAVLLTPDLARQLYEANLDVMQVTIYSHDTAIHDRLVGREGALVRTLDGIRTAFEAGIQVSVNTPIVGENSASYTATINFLFAELGVRHFTASGMLPAGGALKKLATGGAAGESELYEALSQAKRATDELGCELDFTSPGCLTDEQLRGLGMSIPTCGACLGNMAIGPDGEVLPCQSWVHQRQPLGNILTTPWSRIWADPLCKRIRKTSSLKNDCPLKGEVLS